MSLDKVLLIGDKKFKVVCDPDAFLENRSPKLRDISTDECFDLVQIGNRYFYGDKTYNFEILSINSDIRSFNSIDINDLNINKEFKDFELGSEKIEYELIQIDGLDKPFNPNILATSQVLSFELLFFKVLGEGKYTEMFLIIDDETTNNEKVYSRKDMISLGNLNEKYEVSIRLLSYIAIMEDIDIMDISDEIYDKYKSEFDGTILSIEDFNNRTMQVQESNEIFRFIDEIKRFYEIIYGERSEIITNERIENQMSSYQIRFNKNKNVFEKIQEGKVDSISTHDVQGIVWGQVYRDFKDS